MSKNLIFFIKGAISGGGGISSENVLLKIEPINFEGSEIKEVLIKDLNGLKVWINTLPGTDYFLTIALTHKIKFLKMKIENFSVKNSRLEIEDEIKKENVAITKCKINARF